MLRDVALPRGAALLGLDIEGIDRARHVGAGAAAAVGRGGVQAARVGHVQRAAVRRQHHPVWLRSNRHSTYD